MGRNYLIKSFRGVIKYHYFYQAITCTDRTPCKKSLNHQGVFQAYTQY